MKNVEIAFTIFTSDNMTTEASIMHGFHSKIIRSIRRDAAAFKKEYEEDTGELCEDGDYSYAEDIDLSDVLFDVQYEEILDECRAEARSLYPEQTTNILVDTDLADFLQRLDGSDDDD